MNYPKEVLEVSSDIATKIIESGIITDEWPMVTKQILQEEFGKIMFQKWLNGDDYVMTESEAESVLKLAIAIGTVNELIEEGYLDTIEADNQELVFVTEKGKQAAKEHNRIYPEGFDHELN